MYILLLNTLPRIIAMNENLFRGLVHKMLVREVKLLVIKEDKYFYVLDISHKERILGSHIQ